MRCDLLILLFHLLRCFLLLALLFFRNKRRSWTGSVAVDGTGKDGTGRDTEQEADKERRHVKGELRGTVCGKMSGGAGQDGAVSTQRGVGNEGHQAGGGLSKMGEQNISS